MTHALAYIQKNLRRQRYIGATDLRKALNRVKGECTWCGGPVPGSHRRWCGDACREEGYLRSGFVLSPVWKRDDSVCAICGINTMEQKERMMKLWWRARTRGLSFSIKLLRRWMSLTGIDVVGVPFDIDHIVSVVEGGGCCGLDNLRTLCKRCHKNVTKEHAGRRAKARRDLKASLASPQTPHREGT